MSYQILSCITEKPVRNVACQFDYKGFTVSVSTAFKGYNPILAWNAKGVEYQDNTVEGVLRQIDKGFR